MEGKKHRLSVPTARQRAGESSSGKGFWGSPPSKGGPKERKGTRENFGEGAFLKGAP